MAGSKGRGIIIQDRDRHLLRELATMRVIDREQAKCVAGFGSTTRANCRLLGLKRAGLVRRFFLGTIRGTSKALYALSTKGAALVDVPMRGPRRGQNEMLAADFFVAHQLKVNDLYCLLKYRAIPIPDAKLLRWMGFFAPFQGTSLIPDGYFEIAVPTKTIAAFLEIDLGHERGPAWRRKVQEYVQYAVSGDRKSVV